MPDVVSRKITSTGFWPQRLACNEVLELKAGAPLKITNVVAADVGAKMRVRSTISIKFRIGDDQEPLHLVLGSIETGKVEQINCDVLLEPAVVYSIHVQGDNALQILGAFIPTNSKKKPADTLIRHIFLSGGVEPGLKKPGRATKSNNMKTSSRSTRPVRHEEEESEEESLLDSEYESEGESKGKGKAKGIEDAATEIDEQYEDATDEDG